MQTSNLKTRKRSKRKPSDLTMEEVSNVVSLLKNLVADLDEEDDSHRKRPECHPQVVPRHSMSWFFYYCHIWPLLTLSEAPFVL